MPMPHQPRPLAVVTGASTGIGYELAWLCAKHGFDLVVAADEPEIDRAADDFRSLGAQVASLIVDLSTQDGVDRLCDLIAAQGRPVDALCANAGRGLGKAFLDQDFRRMRRMIDTNITGTVYLIHRLGRDMRARGHGRILITGAIAGLVPGSFQAVYHATKAFIDNFAYGLQNELKDSGVSVSCLMPGATETDFFRRADMLDTPIGRSEESDPAEVAEQGYAAMMKGEADVASGWRNQLMAALASIAPAEMLADQGRRIAAPDAARH